MTQQEDTTRQAVGVDALRELWIGVKETQPAMVLVAQHALKALEREAQAEQIITHIVPHDPLDALSLCEGVQALADVLELWVSVNARLWFECEQQGPTSPVHDLHQQSIVHFHHLLLHHYEVQSEVVAFCQNNHVLLRLNAPLLLLTLPLREERERQE